MDLLFNKMVLIIDDGFNKKLIDRPSDDYFRASDSYMLLLEKTGIFLCSFLFLLMGAARGGPAPYQSPPESEFYY